MVRLMQDRVNGRGKRIGLLLQGASTPALDLISAMDNVTEELPDVLLDLGLAPEAGVGGHLVADSAPDGLIRVEVRAVGRQAHQAEADVGRGQVSAQGVAAVGRAVVPDDDPDQAKAPFTYSVTIDDRWDR
jgi:hypothetical protein